MDDGNYTPEQRSRNLLGIFLFTSTLGGIVLASGLLQSWPLGSYLVVAVVLGAIAAILYWLFVSPNARPLPTGQKHARWPYWSKKVNDRVTKR